MLDKFKHLFSCFLRNHIDGTKRDDGITLVEVVISMAVLGCLIVPLMTLFVMSARINSESNKEFMSMLAAQKYIEEVLATQYIDTSRYAFNSEMGFYEREVSQTEDEFEAYIKISPSRENLYIVDVLIKDEGEIINFLRGSIIIR